MALVSRPLRHLESWSAAPEGSVAWVSIDDIDFLAVQEEDDPDLRRQHNEYQHRRRPRYTLAIYDPYDSIIVDTADDKHRHTKKIVVLLEDWTVDYYGSQLHEQRSCTLLFSGVYIEKQPGELLSRLQTYHGTRLIRVTPGGLPSWLCELLQASYYSSSSSCRYAGPPHPPSDRHTCSGAHLTVVDDTPELRLARITGAWPCVITTAHVHL